MNERAITAIEVDHSGRLLVRPAAQAGAFYEHVYREANGIRWDNDQHALCAYEPARWGHEELLLHIAATARGAFDEQLTVTSQTTWVGVPPGLERKLRQVLSQKHDSV